MRKEDFEELEGEVKGLRTTVGELEGEVRALMDLVSRLVRMVPKSSYAAHNGARGSREAAEETWVLIWLL